MDLTPLRELAGGPMLLQLIGLLLLLAAAGAANFATRRGLVAGIGRVARRSAAGWDDALVEARVFSRLAQLAPALVAYYGVSLIPDLHGTLVLLIQRVAIASMVVVVARAGGGALAAVDAIYSANPENRQRPIKGYLQMLAIALYLVAGLLVLAALLDRSPWVFLSGIGAMAAVLMLVFRDTIMGLVASIQLTGNDMVHVGDWIEMPQYGADGDVIDVALHTIKVQNWDKTITTIPTHKLIEDSFKNWRGMTSSGGRRIKRSLSIDLGSIRFLDEGEVETFGRVALLRDYIAEKRRELASYNTEPGRDPSVGADIRRLTNIGTFRAYICSYLRAHPKIHDGMTLLVRQQPPGPEGLPIEIYAFSNDTDWGRYEDLQSDLFDHLLAIAPDFGLRVYQRPSGADVEKLGARP